MDIFKTNAEDSLYWLKVAMIQAQSDIKSDKKEIHELRLEIDRLKGKNKRFITPLDFNGNPFPTK